MARVKKEHNTRRRAAKPAASKKRAASSRKGWETRRENERAHKRELARQSEKRAERKRAREAERLRRSLAAQKGYRRRLAKERARAALSEVKGAVDARARSREMNQVRASWHKAKRELLRAVDRDYSDYLEILDDIADEEGLEWDIGYGEGAAA
jgi:hypothetical protein